LPRSTQFIMSRPAPRPHCTMLPRPTFNNVVDASLLHLLPRPFTTYSKNDVPRRESDKGESREECLAAAHCVSSLVSPHYYQIGCILMRRLFLSGRSPLAGLVASDNTMMMEAETGRWGPP
jgi:hypothetical protein